MTPATTRPAWMPMRSRSRAPAPRRSRPGDGLLHLQGQPHHAVERDPACAIGEAAGHHVGVADRLDLLEPVLLAPARRSRRRRRFRRLDQVARRHSRADIGVKPTMSAKSTETSSNRSAMTSPCRFRLVGDRRGQDVEQEALVLPVQPVDREVRVDARQELVGVERLGDVVDGAQLEARARCPPSRSSP